MIELQEVTRSFHVGNEVVHALDHVSLHIEDGDYLSVMGPSGSGKSTLLNILGLLDRPTEGRYLLDGIDTTVLSEAERARLRRERIGFVFQAFHLVPRMTAAENIELPLILAGVEPAERQRRVTEVIERLGLSARAGHRPDQLSGGQRQRVAIGRALVMHPAVLLADEPTGNLDRASGLQVMELLESLNAEGITLVLVTHDLELGNRAPRRLHMLDGHLERDERA
ncbi:MAG: ABC transporter ATP-binding protein [Gammaproteobacteria bacterium]|nr:MAG: ABC transporter ATP-binding protein [Gammaproteobacteria bacterium]